MMQYQNRKDSLCFLFHFFMGGRKKLRLCRKAYIEFRNFRKDKMRDAWMVPKDTFVFHTNDLRLTQIESKKESC